MDVVKQYIELKQDVKAKEEELQALETIILSEHREDERITIIKGRETLTINADTYENLEAVNVSTKIVEERFKKLEEFDIEIQKHILANESNFTKKVSKESIRIKK